MGAVSPLGVGARTLHERWTAGRSGIEDGLGRCAEFDPPRCCRPRRRGARTAARSSRWRPPTRRSRDAGWDGELPYDPERVGCVIGTGIGGIGDARVPTRTSLRERGPKKVSPLRHPADDGQRGAPPRCRCATICAGPSYGAVSACAAGAHAIGTALRMIQSGDADAVVSGGAEAALVDRSIASFAALEATSPTGISRPFDARRDGFVMGEGAGVLVLEDAEAAAARGARVLGELLGYGATSDAHHLTAPHPEGERRRARDQRWRCATRASSAEDVDYVNAHGTSTPLNDRCRDERAQARARRARVRDAGLVDEVGDRPSARRRRRRRGGRDAARAARPRRAADAQPTSSPTRSSTSTTCPVAARPLAVDGAPPVAISNSFGFGGHNAVLVLRGTAA